MKYNLKQIANIFQLNMCVCVSPDVNLLLGLCLRLCNYLIDRSVDGLLQDFRFYKSTLTNR